MRVAVCDDMVEERREIASYIKKYIPEAVLTEYEDGNRLIEEHREQYFELLVLDILMPSIDGLKIASLIREFDQNTPIIFVTSSDEFAVQSYRVHAYDYILKPISEIQIQECLNRFLSKKTDQKIITVDYLGVETNIRVNSILYLESRLRRVIIHLSEKRVIELSGKLSDYEELIKSVHFCRIHKSFLVNMAGVSKLSGDEFTMKNDDVIKISRANLNHAKKAYLDYMFGNDVNTWG